MQSISFAREDAYIESLVFFKFTSIIAGFSLKNTLKTLLSIFFISTLSENYSFENIIEIYKPFAVLLPVVVVKNFDFLFLKQNYKKY